MVKAYYGYGLLWLWLFAGRQLKKLPNLENGSLPSRDAELGMLQYLIGLEIYFDTMDTEVDVLYTIHDFMALHM